MELNKKIQLQLQVYFDVRECKLASLNFDTLLAQTQLCMMIHLDDVMCVCVCVMNVQQYTNVCGLVGQDRKLQRNYPALSYHIPIPSAMFF